MSKTTIIEFAIASKQDGTIKRGNSFLLEPKTSYDGRKTKWFDDSKLIKK